jgi:hypothetical protein
MRSERTQTIKNYKMNFQFLGRTCRLRVPPCLPKIIYAGSVNRRCGQLQIRYLIGYKLGFQGVGLLWGSLVSSWPMKLYM